jgi:hypothetical protein
MEKGREKERKRACVRAKRTSAREGKLRKGGKGMVVPFFSETL